ncbi:MAG: hypothetical protein RB191_19530 [Terriglobia bacterium]|nr:hypothetical protein [Terriglobia bacterium]
MLAQKSAHKISPEEFARRVFPDAFLIGLGEKFDFEGKDPEIAQAIREIAQGYFAVRARPKSGENRQAARRQYLRLKKDVEKFHKILEIAEKSAIADDMEFVAQISPEFRKPNPENDNLFSKQNRIPKFKQLIALLNLLGNTAARGAEIYSARRGPKIDDALEIAIRRATDFWIFQLRRKFTIDHHKGTGTTKSFEFLRALCAQIDPNISDTKIVSAMRADRVVRRGIEFLSRRAQK